MAKYGFWMSLKVCVIKTSVSVATKTKCISSQWTTLPLPFHFTWSQLQRPFQKGVLSYKKKKRSWILVIVLLVMYMLIWWWKLESISFGKRVCFEVSAATFETDLIVIICYNVLSFLIKLLKIQLWFFFSFSTKGMVNYSNPKLA